MDERRRQTIVLAITGASGCVYAWDLIHKLHACNAVGAVHLIVSGPGRQVLREETGLRLEGQSDLATHGLTRVYWLDEYNFAAPVASGSFPTDAMVIIPCTMGTLGSIASGAGRNLIHRAADVTLKERRPLILVPRETPLHAIHLENMLRLAQAGAILLPAMPSFYHHPVSLQDVIDGFTWRVMATLGLPVPDHSIWQGRP
jgi:4-hydroxy-3-polyprenylbenzoate decarboxylase